MERAKQGPFGGTIAHGYLTLSLIPWLGSQVFKLATPGAKLNYGGNKVRFPNPLLVGKRIRLHVAIADVVDIPKGKQLTVRHTVEIEDERSEKHTSELQALMRNSSSVVCLKKKNINYDDTS